MDSTTTNTTPAPAAQQNNSRALEGQNVNNANHRTLSWKRAAFIMTAATNSLGLLGLPKATASLGLGPSILAIGFLSLLDYATGLMLYRLILQNPHVKSYGELMRVYFGRIGYIVGLNLTVLVLLAIMSSHIVVVAEAIQYITMSYICTAKFMVIGSAIMWVLTLHRGLNHVWKYSAGAMLSIFIATIVGFVGVAKAPHSFPDVPLFLGNTSEGYPAVMKAFSSILFVYMGHVTYPSIMYGMKEPEWFTKALRLQATVTTSMAAAISMFFYIAAGNDVASPALKSSLLVYARAGYGLVLPSVAIAAVISCVVAAKPIYIGWWKFRNHPYVVEESSHRARGSWGLITAILWMFSTIFALLVPNFDQIMPLIGAFFGPILCLILPPLMWLQQKRWDAALDRKGLFIKCAIALSVAEIGALLLVMGMQGSIIDLMSTGLGQAFDCIRPTFQSATANG